MADADESHSVLSKEEPADNAGGEFCHPVPELLLGEMDGEMLDDDSTCQGAGVMIPLQQESTAVVQMSVEDLPSSSVTSSSTSSTCTQQEMERDLQRLLQVLDSSGDRDEKLEALKQISEYAKTRTDIRIELDDDVSEAESEDSATREFPDIPLPDSAMPLPAAGIPLPVEKPSGVDTIPLPQSQIKSFAVGSSGLPSRLSSSSKKSATNTGIPAGGASTVSSKGTAEDDQTAGGGGLPEVGDNAEAVHAQTSIGVITLHLNRKLGPRLSKASVFDLTDENTREVSMKLRQLRKLKRMKKNEGGEQAGEGTARKKNSVEERILAWKEELLKDQGLPVNPSSLAELASSTKSSVVNSADNKTAKENVAAKDLASTLTVKGIALEMQPDGSVINIADGRGQVKSDSIEKFGKSPEAEMAILDKVLNSFVKVQNLNDTSELDWPAETINHTALSPKLVFSCNPLYFNFLQGHTTQSNFHKSGRIRKKRKKDQHRRENELQASEMTGDAVSDKATAARFKQGTERTLKPLKDGVSSESHRKIEQKRNKKDERRNSKSGLISSKTAEKNSSVSNSTKGTTKGRLTRNKSGRKGASDEETKSAAKSDRRLAVGSETRDGNTTGSGDLEATKYPAMAIKDTGKSRWDTSSDSDDDVDTRSLKHNANLSTKEPHVVVQSRSDKSQQLSRRRSAAKAESQLRHNDTSSERSEHRRRSRKRSRYYSGSQSSGSNYSQYSSTSRSSSRYSYHRRRSRRHSGSSRRSDSYSSSGTNNYRDSSRSYHYSRSHSSHRRRRTRSYSYSNSSRSSSRSSHRREDSRLRSRYRQCRSTPNWTRKTVSRKLANESANVSQAKQTPVDKQAGMAGDGASKTKREKSSEKDLDVDSSADTKKLPPEPSEDVKLPPLPETDSTTGDVTTIPTPEEHMQSIPLPLPEQPAAGVPTSGAGFIGPVLPRDHPLAHTQEIPLPATAKFQPIGPNDPLVFRSLPPPPPPPAALTSIGLSKTDIPPPKPPLPPDDACGDGDGEDDIAGDEDPIPQMLDLGTIQPAMIIPPDQAEQYKALQRQAELHARRQRIREETGMDITDDDESGSVEGLPDDAEQQQLLDQLYLEVSQPAILPSASALHLSHQHLIGQSLNSPVAVVGSGAGIGPVNIHLVHRAARSAGGLVSLTPSLVPVLPQAGTPVVLASPAAAAAAALQRAQDEAEAEAQAQQQATARALIAAQQQQQRATELIQVVRMPGGQLAVAPTMPVIAGGSVSGIPLTSLRPAGIPIHSVPVHARPTPQAPTLIQIPGGGIVGLPSGLVGGVQMVAQQQQQAMPLVLGPNGTVLRLIR